jgi:ABC-type amino acid transport system permease subunit
MSESPKKASFRQVLMSTLAALIGVQSDANRQKDFQQSSFVPFLVVGTALAALFIIGLIAIAEEKKMNTTVRLPKKCM